MGDILLVFWLRWRQFRANAVYWLRVIGYESDKPSLMNRLYVIYFLVFSLGWVAMMWLFAVAQACQAGLILTASFRSALLMAIPWLVVVTQALLMYRALRSTPLKLSFPDTAYLVGSPTARYATALIGFSKTVTKVLAIIVPSVALLAVAVDVPLGEAVVNLSGAPAAIVAIPVAMLSIALAWTLGLARLAAVPVLRSAFSWLLPVCWPIAAYLVPSVLLWPGRVLATGMEGKVPVAVLLGLVVLATGAIATMAFVSRQANLIRAADESILYARLSQLGVLRWMQPDLTGQIRSEVALASRGAWLTLPGGDGALSVAGRAMLVFVRHPMNLVMAVISSGVFTYVGATLILNRAPVQLWLLWLFVFVAIPPQGVVREYRADLKELFLRQMLPFSNLLLLVADTALPLAIILSALIALAMVPAVVTVSAFTYVIVVVLVAALEVLCLGLDGVRLRGLGIRASQVWAMVFSFGLVLGLRSISATLILPLAVGVVVALLIAMALRSSYGNAA